MHLLLANLGLLLAVTTNPLSGRQVITSTNSSSSLLIQDDVNTVCHAYWDGTKIQDTKGCAWSMTGTVPQVSRSGLIPPGAGPYTAGSYFLGTGSDVLDFTGDFSLCVILSSTTSASSLWSLGNGGDLTNNTGYSLFRATVSHTYQVTVGTKSLGLVSSTAGGLDVVCFGKSGSNMVYKMNLNAFGTTAINAGWTAATTEPARLGTGSGVRTASPYDAPLYEVWFSSTTPSDALFTSIATRVKQRLGITAW